RARSAQSSALPPCWASRFDNRSAACSMVSDDLPSIWPGSGAAGSAVGGDTTWALSALALRLDPEVRWNNATLRTIAIIATPPTTANVFLSIAISRRVRCLGASLCNGIPVDGWLDLIAVGGRALRCELSLDREA